MTALRAGRAVAAFDSATAMLRATANALRGKDFPHLGHGRLSATPVRLSAFLPEGPRRGLYAWLGAAEGVPADRLGDIDLEAVASWIVDHYPRRRYPGVAIGSSNGAAVHLYAATGIPWLPQTVLVPVRRGANDPDDAVDALEFGRRVAPPLLERNPGVVLHHMHDGNQDRLMVARMTYFRIKWRTLPAAYEDFLTECLEPDAPVVLLEDTSSWPTTRVAERHVFQTGARGGLEPAEYLHGSARVSAFLRAQGSTAERFVAPAANGLSPEAEWGFEPALGDAVMAWANRAGHRTLRIRIPDPQKLADPVADLMRNRIRSAGGRGDRLLLESFAMLEPTQAFRTGSVPYWTFFGVESAQRALQRHLAKARSDGDPYHDVDVIVFPHGVASAGVAAPDRWADLGHDSTGTLRLLAGTSTRWPAHFDTLARYGPALRRLPDGVSADPPPLDLESAVKGFGVGSVEVSHPTA